ncbi:MAG: penicillin-binding protein [Blastocatellia bacterium]
MSKRTLTITLLLGVWMIGIIVRLIWLQVLRHDHYVARAAQNQTSQIETLATRGPILDRNGKELAVSVIFDSIFADQKMFNDKDAKRLPEKQKQRLKTAQILSPLLGMSEVELVKKLTGDSGYLRLTPKLDPEKSQEIKDVIQKNHLWGVAVQREPQRFYPNDSLAAAIVGYMGEDPRQPGQIGGQAGLEKSQNNRLEGTRGEIERDRDGKNQSFGRREISAVNGAQVMTTIDLPLQHKVELLILNALQISHAKGAYAIVLDPATGEILALANAPGFNPNERPKSGEGEARHNRAISWPYEPGSVMKTVTYAAAFEEGALQPSTTLNCGNGEITIGKRVIHDTHAYGVLPAVDAFAKSSNVCAIRVAMSIGKQRFYDYLTAFGFGHKTGIELPAETRGILTPVEKWNGDSIASIAIGQEVSVTLLQVAATMGTIANKGVRMQPHIIKQVAAADGNVLYKAQPEARRVISEQTAQKMSELLEAVVTRGTARHAIQLNGYTAAGKTGTPQKVDPKTGKYSQSKFMPSFAGFVPATDPKFVIVVMLDEPQGAAHQGGSVAAPVFNMIAQTALGDFVVPPDAKGFRDALTALSNKYESKAAEEDSRETEVIAQAQATATPQTEGRAANQAGAQVTTKAVGIAGPGINVSANIAPSEVTKRSQTQANPTPMLQPVAAGSVMPDIRGRGMRAVIQACTQLNLPMKTSGNGIVVRQLPVPGTRIRPGDECKVEFQ